MFDGFTAFDFLGASHRDHASAGAHGTRGGAVYVFEPTGATSPNGAWAETAALAPPPGEELYDLYFGARPITLALALTLVRPSPGPGPDPSPGPSPSPSPSLIS